MAKSTNSSIFIYALMVCVTCSLVLSLVSEGLRDKRELNIALDIKKNILKAVDLRGHISAKATADEILATYNDKIVEYVIDADGAVVEGKTPLDIKEGDDLYPMYEYQENGETMAYAFPVIGKGLWSTLYGYFALEPDAITVRGITFYQHGETPGLGAEIEKDWFLNNFKGKKIWDVQNSKLFPIVVLKGKVDDIIAEGKRQYYVDGISGATITSRGVTAMLEKELNKYEPFFSKKR